MGPYSNPTKTPPDAIETLTARVAELEKALARCLVILENMALENEGAIFNRWPINHEPLRADAKGVIPIARAALKPKE